MPVGPRLRFEVFKRDQFTCRYCGGASPAVVLQVDHIVPVFDGGSDDEMNLVTSCWSCNIGKSNVPLREVITGDDPVDKAILLMEQERQLREYNAVLAAARIRREADAEALLDHWCEALGKSGIPEREYSWLRNRCAEYPAESIRHAMDLAIANGKTYGFRYVGAVLRNQRAEGTI